MKPSSFRANKGIISSKFRFLILNRSWLTVFVGLAVVAVSIFTARVFAAALYVDPGGTCGGNSPCFTTIQAAINAASPSQRNLPGGVTVSDLERKLTVSLQPVIRARVINVSDVFVHDEDVLVKNQLPPL